MWNRSVIASQSVLKCPKKERPKNVLECPKNVLECPKNEKKVFKKVDKGEKMLKKVTEYVVKK